MFPRFCSIALVCALILLVGSGTSLRAQCDISLIESPGVGSDEQFGHGIDIRGDVLAVGAPLWDGTFGNMGAVFVFRDDGQGWVEEQMLTASDASGADFFGTSVSLFGGRLLVGAPAATGPGAAYLFEHDGTEWVEVQKLEAADAEPGDEFGYEVALLDYFAFVGAPGEDSQGDQAGAAYIFHMEFGSWVQTQKLLALEDPQGRFGESMDVDDIVLIVGAPEPDHSADHQGYAKVYRSNAGSWAEEQVLLPSAGHDEDQFGTGVAVEGDEILVGAPDEAPNGRGAVYAFHWDGSTWMERERIEPLNAGSVDHFGYTIDIDGPYAVVGAPFRYGIHISEGSAYGLELQAENWIDLGEIEPSMPLVEFGWRVALDQGRAFISSFRDGAGPDEVYPILGCDTFLRGDCNGDGLLSITDAIFNQNYMFLSGETPNCLDACDTNDDGLISLPDSIVLLTTLFLQGAPPPAPYPDCGSDASLDGIDCQVVTAAACP